MIKARVKFNKTGSMKFIGHLDVMRYFQKAIRRAGIDVAYSQGFSPHQLLSFASPLGVGLTSDGEYMDIQLNSVTTSEDMKQRLNQVMSEEMQVLEIRILPEESKTAMSMLAAADYRISRKDGYSTDIDSLEKEFALFLQQENISFVKKTKKGETTLDLKPFIYLCECKEDALFLQLSCGSVVNIKPEQVMEAFYGFLGKEYNPFAWQLHRIELYTDTNAPKGEINPHGSERTRCLVPLGSFGTLC